MMGGMDDEEGSMKMKRMIYICDSMTMKELDSDGKIFVEQPSRMTRVAKGSGTSVREVEELLSQQRVMGGMASKMSKAQKSMGAMGGQNRQQMAAMQKRMQSLGQGGGMPGAGGGMPDMTAMMKMLGQGGSGGGGGGMPDMSAMMKILGGGGGEFPGMGSMPGMGGTGGAGAGGRGRGRR